MDFLKIKAENDRIYKNGSFPEMSSCYIPDFVPVKNERTGGYVLSEHIRRQTTVECILANNGRRMLALNFANALVAGGAYIMGGNAQEESLCRASMLYYTIKEQHEFYRANRCHILPDYTDGMIFSENVPVIRDDSGRLLPHSVVCSFITCPAVNRYEAALLMSRKKTNRIMECRIEKIVSFAAAQQPELIILGAFGCGAFGNKREEILPMFERAVGTYGGNDAEIIFAIP